MAGATREGGAVSEQGSGGGELPQLREGAPAQRQEALLLWHERVLATVFLEEGECRRSYWRRPRNDGSQYTLNFMRRFRVHMFHVRKYYSPQNYRLLQVFANSD